MYRFLLTPRWLGGAALAMAAAVVMVLLGNWQLHRYHERSATNAHIDAGRTGTPAPLGTVLPRPTTTGTAGPGPTVEQHWARVTVSGQYDPANEILVRGRTVNNAVGYEIVTPLRLADGTAVLVDRGWVPPAPGGARPIPQIPAAPTGTVQVVALLHPSESTPGPIERREGRIQARRVAVGQLAAELPYPVYGAYLLLTEQTPANDPAFTPIPVEHENALQNGGYAIQWWVFAAMALGVYVWLARREAHPAAKTSDTEPAPSG